MSLLRAKAALRDIAAKEDVSPKALCLVEDIVACLPQQLNINLLNKIALFSSPPTGANKFFST